MNVEIHMDPSKRQKDGLLAISVRVPDQELVYELDLPFRKLYDRFGIPDPIVLDFLLIASLCYVLDKAVPRGRGVAPDNWTREFEVAFPVSDVRVWKRVAGDFAQALGFLSGDIWRVSFVERGEVPIFAEPARRRRSRKTLVLKRVAASKVCLFSGGLDSLAGAIDLLSGDDSQQVLLVGHYDLAGPASQQNNLFTGLRERYPARSELIQARVSHKPDSAPELTLRSRSLVFIALGIYAARSFGNDIPLYAPENGVIAINLPLTPSRAGSCSTRTMHPFFLERLRSVLRKLGFKNPIVNPFEFKTKGECVVGCFDHALLTSLVAATCSCSHGTRRQHWVRKQVPNCGYCVPCLFRRAALHKAGLDAGWQYGVDACEGELPLDYEGESANDLRALLDFIQARKTSEEIAGEIVSIAPVQNLSEHVAVVERGFDEVRSLLQAKAVAPIRRAAGIGVTRS
ncbi:MAG TPA: Qat anti-phage system QueC-like protein QatC [Thermoanaerobaculia bacterium]|jgi:7-cyano-7-deazaguanine synthase in queuosine biosynthesis|nr:Qat anti-phage system QueC-like protein QatC [Thermoanaerobaculia bacterium]